MRIGSLFSGYGGLDMGVQAVLGGEVAWHVEYDKAPSRILAHHWPDVPNYGDVTALDFTKVEPVDVLTGGYPCQPFSHAGKRKGTHDDRHLWPHVLRAIRDLGPSLAVLENVRGHLTLGFDVVLADLADLGWSAEWGLVRASDAGAPHQRARLFIVAYPDRGLPQGFGEMSGLGRRSSPHGDVQLRQPSADADVTGSQAWGDARQDGKRVRVESVGFADAPAYADCVGLQHSSERVAGNKRASATTRHRESTTDAASAEWRAAQSEHLGAGHRAATELGERPSEIAWGAYAPAITRWEHVTGRPAPAPTKPGRTGAPRLSPAFVEWMMGLPAGWVTDPAIGISRNDQLKALGNGVVPQQAALALSLLLPRVEAVAA